MSNDDGTPNAEVQSTLSTAQIAEMESIFEAKYSDFFVKKYSGKILNRVWAIIAAVALIIGGFLTWAGYRSYQEVTDGLDENVKAEVASQVSSYIDASTQGIRSQIREIVNGNVSPLVSKEVSQAINSQARPELNILLEEFDQELEVRGRERLSQVSERFVRIFPVLTSLQELEETNPAGLDSRFVRLEDNALENDLTLQSLQEELTQSKVALETLQAEIADIDTSVAQNYDQIQDSRTTVQRLEEEIARLADVRDATETICTLFQVLPAENIINALGYPAPSEDDGEYTFRLESAVSDVKQSCR